MEFEICYPFGRSKVKIDPKTLCQFVKNVKKPDRSLKYVSTKIACMFIFTVDHLKDLCLSFMFFKLSLRKDF